MDKKQQNEWAEAQKIAVSFDLVKAAKKQLLFLAAVDRNRHLYEDHVLQRAIYRYNAYWLPLLAKHAQNPASGNPLVVPLDCEWIWHCHRLNPIRYKLDCQKLYGRILGCHNVISSVQATSENASATVEIWNKMYPEEPYELDINRSFSKEEVQNSPQDEKFTSYDLLAAVKRQISFTFQVSRPHVSDDLFLQEAEARYKGFLHLARGNVKNRIQRFCVPTYDIDLMWHTHQLYPIYYCKDLINLIGRVLQHDDTDSDRTKGGALDTGFTETTKQWEETFGTRYWKAGAMYRGSTPTPVTHVPYKFRIEDKKSNGIGNYGNRIVPLSERKAVEVFLECVEIKNLPEDHKDNLIVSFSKKQTDMLFNINRSLTISSESGEKQVAYFQCEPTGEFLFELKSESSSDKLKPKSSKVLGSCSLSLQELVSSRSQLSAEKWLTVDPVAGLKISEPILLHVSVSFTPPTPAPQVFHLGHSQDSLRFLKSSSLLPLLKTGKVNHAKTQTYVTDDVGKVALSLQMRTTLKDATKCNPDPQLLKEVYYITDSGEKYKVAEFLENNWVIKGMHGSFTIQKNSGNDDHLFELVGNKMVKLFSGRRLDFEPRHCGSQRSELEFITAVEFSTDYPYGRAVALYDLKLGTVKALDESMVLPGIILGFILPDVLERQGYSGFTTLNGDEVSACVNKGNGAESAPGFDWGAGCKDNACVNKGNGAESGPCFGRGAGCKDNASVNKGSGVENATCFDWGVGYNAKGGSCGSGQCSGGKCGGGKCGGVSMDMRSGDCSGTCRSRCVGVAGCSGGGCNGQCGGKCGFPDAAGCSGGGCNGQCGGKCGFPDAAGCSGGGCNGQCGGKCGFPDAAGCGIPENGGFSVLGGGCGIGSAYHSGGHGIPDSGDFSVLGGGCGIGSAYHSGGRGIPDNGDFSILGGGCGIGSAYHSGGRGIPDSGDFSVLGGGCGIGCAKHSGGCGIPDNGGYSIPDGAGYSVPGGGGSGGGMNVSGNDMATVVLSILNEPAAA
ncbi:hypothetical protein vseg_019509 [Gypsophila vaccaria]